MSGCGMTGSGRRWLRLTVLAACLAGAVRGETAEPARRTIDGFDAPVFDVARHWDPHNHLMGGLAPDRLTFDQTALPGCLTIRCQDDGDGEATLIARDDVRLAPGEWMKLDVAIAALEARSPVRVGVGLVSSRGRHPGLGGAARANAIAWGLDHTGRARGHAWGDGGREFADIGRRLVDPAIGSFVTLLIRRSGERTYEFYAAAAGAAVERCGEPLVFGGSTGPAETPPDIPGIFLDPGLGSYVVLVDDFEIGTLWPVPPGPPRPAPPSFEVPRAARGPGSVALVLPDDIDALPRLAGSRHLVHMPGGADAFTYHHAPEIVRFKGAFFLAWTATPRSEATLPYRPWVATSGDGERWSEPVDVAADGDAAYRAHMAARLSIPTAAAEDLVVNAAPRHWHATDDRLYLWTLGWTTGERGRDWLGRVFWTEDGRSWHEVPPKDLDRLEATERLAIRTGGSNRGFTRLHDGRLLAAALGPPRDSDGWRQCAPVTVDPTGMGGWEGGWIDTRLAAEIGEPCTWQGSDGALHYVARGTGTHVWHASSVDGGATWSRLEAQGAFPDNPGNKAFGSFATGGHWYVGNPVPLAPRVPLVLGTSADGWTFDRAFLVRWEPVVQRWPAPAKTERPGYEYPTAVEHDGHLYVAYSVARDAIEITKIDLRAAGIAADAAPAAAAGAAAGPDRGQPPSAASRRP